MGASDSASGSDAVDDAAPMRIAHSLAMRGWGRTYPNPMVGAVVVRDGAIVGRGWHAEFGDVHAEAAALREAGAAARGGTLHVTLEPCAHTGKQPPCTDAIIGAGIARVVMAARDPDPVAAGGAERLRQAGITVELDPSPTPYNFRFQHRVAGRATPWVAVKLAVTMDGMIADAAGRSQWISSPPAREWVHWLRAGFGAIGVGADTALTDDARLTVRGAVVPRVAPTRVVFDRSGRVPPGHRIFADAGTVPVIVIVGSEVAGEHRAAVTAAGAIVIVEGRLENALQALADAGVDSILVEGGGRLAGALLDADLVDRVYQVQSPRWLGQGTPAWPGVAAAALDSARRWEVIDARRLGTDPHESDVLIELGR